MLAKQISVLATAEFRAMNSPVKYIVATAAYVYKAVIMLLFIHLFLLLPLLLCQPRVEVTSCFVYKVMGLTFHDRINTQLIYRFELAQVVARRIAKPQRIF